MLHKAAARLSRASIASFLFPLFASYKALKRMIWRS